MTNLQSLQRGLEMILVFDAEHSHLTLSEAARRAGQTRATARRVLHTLADLGYVVTDGRTFALRPRILELGHAYLSSLSLPAIVQPHLERLTEQVGESSSVAVLDDADIVYVARVARRRIMTAAIEVGTRLPAYLTSMGRVILAELPAAERRRRLDIPRQGRTPFSITDPEVLDAELTRIRRQGWALVDQELEEGLRSIAVPLHDRPGSVVAGMNVSASARRGSVEEIRAQLLPALQAAAAAVEADLVVIRPVL
jgi:IclR family transcriptional regulator, pca regulon regulatory protein